jgi:glycosyltransferase involved in cell wall biosynthesis
MLESRRRRFFANVELGMKGRYGPRCSVCPGSKRNEISLKTAIVHYWMLSSGGAERVVEVLASAYPEADIYGLFKCRGACVDVTERMKCSFVNRIPLINRIYKSLLPLYPLAAESLDLRGYDLVISSDTNVMKGVLVDQDAVHICYCHTPMRYVWDLYRDFLMRTPMLFRPIFAITSHYLRLWDYSAAQRVDYFVANSRYIQDRIRKVYRRESTVIYPPVEIARGYISDQHEDFYLSVGRLSATKKLDLLIHACNRLGRRLVIAGTGVEEKRLKSIAGPTIEFRGRVPEAELAQLYAKCRAFLFAADEDFGIVPVEAQSYGRPVIAYGHGGVLETVKVNSNDGSSDTGLFFAQQTVDSVVDGILRFEAREDSFTPQEIQNHARQFDVSVFLETVRQFVDNVMAHQL